jgi:DNA replication protein DnaC
VAERRILKQVGALYLDAKLDDLDEQVREKLLALESGRDVFMHGAIGTGKTYANAALIRRYVYEGYECMRINFDDFCVQVRSTMSPVSKLTEWDMIEPLKQVDRLFVDDLGLRSKQEKDFAYVTLYSILNKRQERMLPTFISSNKSIEQLGQSFDARVASRLQTALVIEFTGEDKRVSGTEV